MVLQMRKRERSSCPSSVRLPDLQGLWSGFSLASLLRETAKSCPASALGKLSFFQQEGCQRWWGGQSWTTSTVMGAQQPSCPDNWAGSVREPWTDFCCPQWEKHHQSSLEFHNMSGDQYLWMLFKWKRKRGWKPKAKCFLNNCFLL